MPEVLKGAAKGLVYVLTASVFAGLMYLNVAYVQLSRQCGLYKSQGRAVIGILCVYTDLSKEI